MFANRQVATMILVSLALVQTVQCIDQPQSKCEERAFLTIPGPQKRSFVAKTALTLLFL